MTKAVKIAFAVLCAGALVAGVGAGVAFGEYSALDYEKYEVPGAQERKAETRTLEVPADGNIEIGGAWSCSYSIVEDEGVAAGTVVVTASASGLADKVVIGDPTVSLIPRDNRPDASSRGSAEEPYGGSPDKLGGDASGSVISDVVGESSENWVEHTVIVAYPTTEGTGFSQFMDMKDVYLEGMKRGVVYEMPSVYDDFTVEVRVNPADAGRISLR